MGDIEDQRARLRLLEKGLEPFGFDPRRGLETHSVREIKKLAMRSGFSKDFLKSLGICLHEHVNFYAALHRRGFVPLMVERDMPEKNIQAIQEWLENHQKGVPRKKVRESILAVLSKNFLGELGRIRNPSQLDGWYEKLRESYKREYDIYRFIDTLAKLYNEYVGSETLLPNQNGVEESAIQILRAIATKKLENGTFLEFISNRLVKNRRVPRWEKKEKR